MNVYDFDGTIYRGDSTVEFYLFCLSKKPRLICFLPKQLMGLGFYFVKKIDKSEMKRYFFSFLRGIDDPEAMVQLFWDKNNHKIEQWYREKKKLDDLVISASPEFLLEPVCKQNNIGGLLASKVDIYTGEFYSPNCRGEEKVRRFYEAYPEGKIEEFYSDSFSDKPLADIAEQAFLVNKGGLKKFL